MSKKKIFVLDTSVLMHDPGACHTFKEHEVVLPFVVLEELDRLKRDVVKGGRAREVSRELQKIRNGGSITQGVKTPGGGIIRVDLDGNGPANVLLPGGFDGKKADNIIILTACKIQKEHPEAEVILVTKDTIMAIKAESMGIGAEDYLSDKVSDVDTRYTGLVDVKVSDDAISTIHQGGKVVSAEGACIETGFASTLSPNLCCRLIGENGKTTLAIYKHEGGLFHLVGKPSLDNKKEGIHPRNDEQAFALKLGMDSSIKIVTLSGAAGTGKSLMAILAGYKLINGKGSFSGGQVDIEKFNPKKLVIFRPTYELGKELGFLPGSMDEKFAPWQRPAISNLRLVAEETEEEKGSEEENGGRLKRLMENGSVEILPINYIRGDTLHHSFIIVDDAQNLTPHEIKAVITRVGEGSKIIINGDMRQVDVSFLGPDTNGLAHVVAKCVPKKWPKYAHLQLFKGERSEVAEFAAEIL